VPVAIGALAVTQNVGWGTTYFLPSVLAGPLSADLGLSREAVFGGVTIMLLVGAAAGPRAGTLMDRGGVRSMLTLGSVLMAAALLTLATSAGFAGYAFAWVLFGLAMPLALTQGSLAALARTAGGGARRAFGAMLLLTGFSASIFWPLTAWLDGLIGWRGTCLVFAATHLVLCLPLHLLVTSRSFERAPEPAGAAPAPGETAGLDAAEQRRAFVWTALAFSLAGFVSWGLPLSLIEILKGLGYPAATAVALASLMGPAQVAARLGETLFGNRFGILSVGLASTLLMPFAILLPLAAGGSLAVAALFVVGYGLSAGAFTIVRSVAPLWLFGREGFAAMTGRLLVPQNVAFALAPPAYAGVISTWGPNAALWLSLVGSLLALAAMAALVRAARHRD